MISTDSYDHLVAFLETEGAEYRLIEHPPEGRTDIVSRLRGHPVSAAIKCLVLLVKVGRKSTRYILAAVPGDKQLDRTALKAIKNATFVGLAPAGTAEELSGSVVGAVLPFAFDQRLELIADPGLLENEELFFNAGRLDRSIALKTNDYLKLAKPRLERIAAR